MKQNTARNWIWQNAKTQLSGLVLLIFGNALSSVCAVSLALFAKAIIDAAESGDKTRLLASAGLLAAVILLQIGLRMGNTSLAVRVAGRLEMRCKRELFSAILQKNYAAVTAYHSGDLLMRLSADVTVVCDGVATLLPSAVSMLTRLVCAFAVIVSLDWRFGLLLMAAGTALFFGTRLFRSKIKKLHKQVQSTDGKLRAFLQEALESLLAVQVFGVQEKVARQADEHQTENYKAKIRKNRWAIFANTGFSAVFSLGFLVTLVWCGLRLLSGEITFGTLTALLQLVNQVQVPLSGLSGLFPQYYAMLASAERILEITGLPDDAERPVRAENSAALRPEAFSELQFSDVSFAYGKNQVLEHVSFSVQKNDFVVISGISGIGKSTLFKLLLGVLTPDSGEITVCTGEGAHTAGKRTRPIFAYVPQGNLLFSGTVRDNIRFIKENATDAEVEKAIRIACADRFISDLPNGLDTVLGEGGRGLSEGQMQRLAVARAVLTDAPVLLLDEATSALDEETEARLLANIRTMQNKTCIIISHKKAAFSVCEKELVIADRKITMRAKQRLSSRPCEIL